MATIKMIFTVPPQGIQITDKDQIQMYVYGGKGKFRMKSLKSGKEFIYKISPMSKNNPRYDEYTYYVSLVLPGGSEFMGVMKSEENKYIHSKKSYRQYDSPEVKGINWLLHQFEIENEFPSDMEFYHMGVCSCCGKGLTDPQSIELGIGPICFSRYGNKRLKKLLHLKKKIEQRMKKMGKTLAEK